jgi:hypothetical protein
MSTDLSSAAFAPLDAAADESQPPAAAPPPVLAELAAALAHIEALLADGAEGSEGAAAIERIADIAFVLHERDVERSLCDALDAAVRDIGAADALKRASVQRGREAAALLRKLTHALNEMVAMADVEQPQPAVTVADATPSSSSIEAVQDSPDAEAVDDEELAAPTGLFDADMPEDDAFTLTVAELAESLPEGVGAAPVDSWHAAAESVASLATSAYSENIADEETIEAFQPKEVIDNDISAEENLHKHIADGQSVVAADAGFGAGANEHAVLPEAFYDEPAAPPDRAEMDERSDLQTAASAVVEQDQEPPRAELTEGEPIDALAPAGGYGEAPAQDNQSAVCSEVAPEPMTSQRAADPNEDPGDLFEPAADPRLPPVMPVPAAIVAPKSDGEAACASIPLDAPPFSAATSTMVAAEAQPTSASALRLPPVSPADAAPQLPASDPLAPIRALSAEELIALFS